MDSEPKVMMPSVDIRHKKLLEYAHKKGIQHAKLETICKLIVENTEECTLFAYNNFFVHREQYYLRCYT
jgi:hypothetical protein